jgi:hypothetical protein
MPQLSPSVQKQLPLDVSLGNLCPGAETPPHFARELRRKAETLLREIAANPNSLVTYTFYIEEEGPTPRVITVREVAELQLNDLRDGAVDGSCAPELQRRLEAALS